MTQRTETTKGLVVRELADDERGLPCFVRHEDAGGQCERLATMRVYGLLFCEEHGEEAGIGALAEAFDDATWFFERFRNPHVPGQSSTIERALEVALEHLNAESPAITDYNPALLRAYPASVIPETVRAQVRHWQEDEAPGRPHVFDHLLDMLATLHKLQRIAFEEREVWLVEVLEKEREPLVVQAAAALEDLEHQKRAPAGA